MISRLVYRKRRGRRVLALAAAAGLSIALLTVVGVALAVHGIGLFELDTNSSATTCAPLAAPCGDANVADDTGVAGDDWANVYKSATGLGAAGADHAFGRAFITDPVSSAENSFFTGGGSKDVNDINQWQYATTNDVVPDKDDIANLFAAAYQNAAKETILYFGMDRYDNSGDSQTGFWFFKNKVSLQNGQFSGVHSVGDVLVLVDWGGSNPVGQMTVYSWAGGKNPLTLVYDNATSDCATAGSNDNICAVVNRQNVTPPWTFLDKANSAAIRPLELFEAGINLNQVLGTDQCFASMLGETRSSHSTTAQLKDLALASFENCGAAIQINPSATNDVGQSHTFTVHVTKSVGGIATGASGVKPTVTLTASNGATISNKVDTCASTGTNSSGDCTVTFTSTTGGLVTGHATATVTIGTDSFSVATDGQSPNSGDAVKRFVNGSITIAGTATNEVGQLHTFTVTVKKDAGLGGGLVAAAGEHPTVTLTAANGATASNVTDNCASSGTNASGQCTVTFNSNTAGTITGHASVSLAFAAASGTPALTISRQTDGVAPNSGDVVKTYVDAYITIETSATNEVGHPHTFTITVKQDAGNGGGFVNVPDGTKPTVTLTPSTFTTANTCASAGTVNGQCTVTVNSTTGTTITAHASVTLTLAGKSVTRSTDGTGSNSGDAVKRYVDAWITIGSTATNEVNHPHTFTVTVKQDAGDGSGFVNVPDGTKPTITLTDQASNPVAPTSNACASTGTTAGQCTVTVNSAVGITITAHASVSLTFAAAGGAPAKTVTRQTDGTGNNSGDAVKTYVDAYITIGPSATNTVGDPHTFTVTVKVDRGDGNGFVNGPDGAIPTVTLTPSASIPTFTTSGDTCSNPGLSGGTCSITVNSAYAGTITAHATVTVILAGKTVTRATDGQGSNSGDAVKTYVAGSIAWEKVDNAGDPLAGATFTVCRTKFYPLPSGPLTSLATAVCVDIADNGTGDADARDGYFKYAGIPLGQYTVVEKSAPAGFLLDPKTETVDVIPGSSDITIATPFVNGREILKIAGFGYTNEAVGTPTKGVTHGSTTFSMTLHNYGTAPANLTNSSLAISSTKVSGTLTCNGTSIDGMSTDLSGIVVAPGATSAPVSITCEYNVNDGAQVIADLVVKSTTNGLERDASGSPAEIRFTVQGD